MEFSRLKSSIRLSVSTLLILGAIVSLCGQLSTEHLHLMQPDSTANKVRQYTAFGLSGGIFVSSGVGLYTTWYSQFEQSPFHLFDDSREWNQMDKYGHVYTTYFQSEMCYKVARWTGMSKRGSVLYGAACGLLLQGTVEVFDGFSEKWGFSVYDLAANTVGAGLFAWQQLAWDEQRIRVKLSSQLGRTYDGRFVTSGNGTITSLEDRATNLFGAGIAERFLKDYNSQTYWLSVNLHSFGVEVMPKWLNLAVGFGAENLFGGFENVWQDGSDSFEYQAPRFRQFYFGPDIDFAQFNPRSHWVKTLFSVLNVYKLPMPSVEYSQVNGWSYNLLLLRR